MNEQFWSLTFPTQYVTILYEETAARNDRRDAYVLIRENGCLYASRIGYKHP